MNCAKCNASLPEESTFCGVCGYKVEAPQIEEVAAVAPAPVAETEHAPQAGIIGGSITEGWEAFKKRSGLMVGMLVVVAVVMAIANSLIVKVFGSPGGGTHSIATQVWALVQNVLSAGMIYSILKVLRDEEVAFGELFSGFSRFVPLVIAYILMILAVILGLIALVVPGIILALGLSQYMLLIMDKDAGAVEALKGSWQMMRGYKWSYFGLGLCLIGINILGLLALGIGLLVTIPVSLAAVTAFYNRVLVENPPSLD